MKKPKLVVAADWSVRHKKRWMVRALYDQNRGQYTVHNPERVGDLDTLLDRLRADAGCDETVLVGFDFPIGLPRAYAEKPDLLSFRQALAGFGTGIWKDFYEVSNDPGPYKPFFPKDSKSGGLKAQLVQALQLKNKSELLRQCDQKTPTRRNAAESLFFTLGPKQVGRAAIVGWKQVLAPALNDISLWPFDGPLEQLLDAPGIVVAEIYPAEAYGHLGIEIGGTGQSKGNREHRKHQSVRQAIYSVEQNGRIKFSDQARARIDSGFNSDDDFDAMVGLLSMLKIVTGVRTCTVPDDSAVQKIEGWILGQRELKGN